MRSLTIPQQSMLRQIVHDGERRVTTVVGTEKPARWWRTLEALIDRGLVKCDRWEAIAYGRARQRVYIPTEAGLSYIRRADAR